MIDFGRWGRDERSALRQAAAERSAGVETHCFEVSPVEQRRQLGQRLADDPHTTSPTRNWPDGPTSHRSQHQERSTAANRSMIPGGFRVLGRMALGSLAAIRLPDPYR